MTAPRAIFIWCVSLTLFAGLAAAQAPDRSERPKKRPWEITYNETASVQPATAVAALQSGNAYAPARSARPRARRSALGRQPATASAVEAAVSAAVSQTKRQPAAEVRTQPEAVTVSLRPKKRPRTLQTQPQRQRTAALANPVIERDRRSGSVCGEKSIRGQSAPALRGRLSGCGIANPVRITQVAGVRLTRSVTINCGTAKALASWVERHAKPAVGSRGGGLAQVQAVAGYSCRTRNSRAGAKLSEHAKGNAIDLAGFVTQDGEVISVLDDWGKGRKGRILKKLHSTACGPFGTVLGPNADKYHLDHFHMDIANHRSGAYCR